MAELDRNLHVGVLLALHALFWTAQYRVGFRYVNRYSVLSVLWWLLDLILYDKSKSKIIYMVEHTHRHTQRIYTQKHIDGVFD